MAKPPARRQTPHLLPDLRDWLDAPWAPLLPFGPASMFRVEDYVKDNVYIVRAELPGMDPDTDIEITVDDGTLTIHAERREETKEAHRSEFRYGSFTRSVTLPHQADTEHITAAYDKGILEVSVPVPEAKAEGRRIAITTTS
ncbi:MAG TPA: Hsp20/alpha crystallin family protein [Streptosporangiaceae bacterium]|nr:Hsp20/alpha crystallin family protein [Streptosporangiaceae bacterium]